MIKFIFAISRDPPIYRAPAHMAGDFHYHLCAVNAMLTLQLMQKKKKKKKKKKRREKKKESTKEKTLCKL